MTLAARNLVRLRRQLQQLIRDRSSGAAEVAVRAATLMTLARELGLSEHRLNRLASRILKAHPAMGAVWNAVRSEDPASFARTQRVHLRNTVRRARQELPRRGRVLTLSYSSTVLGLLGRKGYHVLVAQSEPGGEGKRAARRLQRTPAEVTMLPDAALALAARQCDFALVGADAVTPAWIVNKVGTHLLGLACQACETPAYVVADGTKLVPEEWPLPETDVGAVFESVPRRLFARVICDVL